MALYNSSICTSPNQGRQGRVIVRVAASTMNSLDHKILTYGILAQDWPWIGGNEYAGTVVSVGPAVENLVVGDRVVAVGVNFIEGQEVSGWQEYALLRADLCTKLADHIPFDKACTVPTAFTSASIAIALELGLKYPDPPPAPPKKSAASIWESAMAALGNGATFGWDLKEGTIQDGVWLPKPKVSAIQGAPLSPEAIAEKAEAERLRREEEERKAKARRENDARIHATLTKAFAEQVEKRRAQGPQPSTPRVPGYGTHPRQSHCCGTDPDPWANTHPMPWDTYDMGREAMDRRWGSGWENGRAYSRFEVVGERHNAPGLGLSGLGLELGPRFGAAGLVSPGSVRADNPSPCGSTSISTSMGRSGSDDSNTSASASELATMSASYPRLPVPSPVPRRGSEPSLRAHESLSAWMGARSAPGPDLMPTIHRSPLLPTQSTNLVAPRPRSSGSIPSKARSPVPRARGTTSPLRVPATLSGRGRGRGSPPYRVREQSPMGHRPSYSLEIGVKTYPTLSDRHDPVAQLSINGAATPIPTLTTTFPNPSSDSGSNPGSWSVSAGGGVPNTFFPAPLTRTENPVYVMDEPILIWGGATCVGRAALQLLKRAGYTNLLVVAAYERHVELAKIAPTNTSFFDYRATNIVDQIRSSIGAQKLNKVLDTVAMPYTLEPISQLVTSGAKIAALLPVNTPMPDGVEVKPVMFGRCHDYSGKDVLSLNFGKETMWPLLGELLRKGEWVYPPAVHLSGGLQACAVDAMRMMSSPDYTGKRLVFEISNN